MPWKSQGGGPWGGGGSGGPQKGPQPPDIEELLRQSQDRVKQMLPGGLGGARGIILLLIAAIGLWMASGFYRVSPGEQGVELLFGKVVKQTSSGLNYWFPAPFGEALTPNVERTNTINIGFRSRGDVNRGGGIQDVPKESLMLTGDQNIIDIDFVVQWRIKDASEFLFNIRNPEATIKIAAESAMREVVGRTALEEAITKKRQQVELQTRTALQKILDSYKAGVFIDQIKMKKVDPPSEVIDAFNDVQRAKQDQERKSNEAQAYLNDIVPRARGEAKKLIQEAEAYKQQVINEAKGEAQRFLSVYRAYKENKLVTKRRIYLERMQEVLSKVDKIIIDSGKNGSGVVPYLPLPELKKRKGGN